MSDDLGFIHDHGEIAWGHFLAQHVGKANTEDFVLSFYPPINILDEVLNELYTKRWIKTAEGSALDGCGNIVGLSRIVPEEVYLAFFGFVTQPSGRAFGVARMRKENEPYSTSNTLGDVEYRARIIAKIALNNGHGTAEQIMRSMQDALGVSNVRIFDMGNANANLYINELISQNDPRFYIIDKMVPRAAGVKIWPYLTDQLYTFGFEEQRVYYGFGVGVMARTPPSNIPPIGP
jgi:hypothetical protein